VGLRISPNRERALAALLSAGRDGIAVDALIEDHGDAHGLLVSHGLAEDFTDRSRTLTDRVRLTSHGAKVASWLTERSDAA
jgi:hypothetical protein